MESRYDRDMSDAALRFDDLPTPAPLLDEMAVEQARLIRMARDHLATTERSVDYRGLSVGRACTELAARQWVKRQRDVGRLFVVEHGNRMLVPAFQLDEAFDLDDAVTPAVISLLDFGMNGWAAWQWFTAHNPWIDARPIDVIGTDKLAAAIAGLTGAG